MNSGVSLASFLLGGVAGIIVGVVFAVTRQWFRDLRDTKKKIPVLRKGAWGSLWSFAQAGVAALLVLIGIGWWAYRDATDHRNTPLVPVSTPSAVRSR